MNSGYPRRLTTGYNLDMQIQKDVALSDYSTMRLGGTTKHLVEVTTKDELIEAVNWAKRQNLPIIMIGSGANIVWKDQGFDGLVLVNKIRGFQMTGEGQDIAYVTVGAGEVWDQVVEQVVAKGYSGVEQLSLIPGTAGAAPVQNIGAYGRELDQVMSTVEAYDTQTSQLVNLRASDCGFTYRNSRFKTTDKGRFLITAITFSVNKGFAQPPFYKDIESYFAQHPPADHSPATIRLAVIAIRSAKLPDVSKVANCGSFFKNPVVEREQFDVLMEQNSELSVSNAKWTQRPFWELPDGRFKLSAGRLIEIAGFDNYHDDETGIGQWPNQNLILVNEHAKSTADLMQFAQKVTDAVQAKFGLTLELEPEFLPQD